MPPETQLQGITHTIQLAIAPVFMLSGIATLLSVFTNRLARVVDRARFLETRMVRSEAHRQLAIAELKLLSRRGRLIHAALSTSTSAALLVCLLIAVAFVGYLFKVNLGEEVAILFILGIGALVMSLLLFLREVYIAIAALEFGLPPEAQDARKHDPAAPV